MQFSSLSVEFPRRRTHGRVIVDHQYAVAIALGAESRRQRRQRGTKREGRAMRRYHFARS